MLRRFIEYISLLKRKIKVKKKNGVLSLKMKTLKKRSFFMTIISFFDDILTIFFIIASYLFKQIRKVFTQMYLKLLWVIKTVRVPRNSWVSKMWTSQDIWIRNENKINCSCL